MRLVEAVARELLHRVEDFVRKRGFHALVRRGTFHEALALGDHLLKLLLTHGAPQEVSITERIAGDLLRHPHHLLLIDRHTISGFQHRFQVGVSIPNAFGVLLSLNIDRDVLHRARTVQRDDGDHVFEAVRAHLLQRVAHACAFQLEHAQRVATGHQVIGRLIVKTAPFRTDIATVTPDEFQRPVDHRQGFQAKEVELHKSGCLGVFHVELGCRKIGARIIVQRHQFHQRPVTDHHTSGVCACVAVFAFQRQRYLEEFSDALVGVHFLVEFRFVVDGFLKLWRVGRIERDQLCQPVHLAVGHLHHAADIAHHSLRL